MTTYVLKADSRNFENPLTSLVLDTYAYDWGDRKFIHSKGIEGWLYLVSHYNGYFDSERCITPGRHKLSNIFYKNDMTFNFETFSINMKSTFDTMDKYGEGRSNQDKDRTLQDKIRTKNQKLESTTTF